MRKQDKMSTRTVILHHIKMHRGLSINDLAGMLGITEMAVRRHIQMLEKDGYVQSSLSRKPLGRPAHIYSLTRQAEELFPKNYHTLALDLLQELDESDGVTVATLFARRKERLIRKYASQMEGKTLSDRVATLADIQESGGYMVEWDERQDGYWFHEYNCPISEVAYQYSHACQCELELFESLLGTEVKRTECLAEGGGKCTYQIRHRQS